MMDEQQTPEERYQQRRRRRLERYATWSREEFEEFERALAEQRPLPGQPEAGGE